MDPALHGAQGQVERVGGLLQGTAFEVVEDDDGLVLGGQAGDALTDDLAELRPLGARVGLGAPGEPED